VGTGTLYIEPGSPWENGKLRDECLNGEIFYSLKEAQIVIEKWRVEYNTKRPHSALLRSKRGIDPNAPVGTMSGSGPDVVGTIDEVLQFLQMLKHEQERQNARCAGRERKSVQ